MTSRPTELGFTSSYSLSTAPPPPPPFHRSPRFSTNSTWASTTRTRLSHRFSRRLPLVPNAPFVRSRCLTPTTAWARRMRTWPRSTPTVSAESSVAFRVTRSLSPGLVMCARGRELEWSWSGGVVCLSPFPFVPPMPIPKPIDRPPGMHHLAGVMFAGDWLTLSSRSAAARTATISVDDTRLPLDTPVLNPSHHQSEP